MAEISISAEWFASLSRYMDKLQADTAAAAANAVSFLRDRVVERARETPEWSDLADDITVWSQDGYLFLGVNNQDRVSEAMALEYGDEVRPPSALFRSLSSEVREANKRWKEEMEAHGYTYGAGIVGGPR
jgi:molybdopterin converting factor small subunit